MLKYITGLRNIRKQGLRAQKTDVAVIFKITELSETQRLKREVEQLKRENKLQNQTDNMAKVKELKGCVYWTTKAKTNST